MITENKATLITGDTPEGAFAHHARAHQTHQIFTLRAAGITRQEADLLALFQADTNGPVLIAPSIAVETLSKTVRVTRLALPEPGGHLEAAGLVFEYMRNNPTSAILNYHEVMCLSGKYKGWVQAVELSTRQVYKRTTAQKDHYWLMENTSTHPSPLL
jgi:hypothetical protein